jgi:hypothetical protein
MRVQLFNSFHGGPPLDLNIHDGRFLSAKQIEKARKSLCPHWGDASRSCPCEPVLGLYGDQVVDINSRGPYLVALKLNSRFFKIGEDKRASVRSARMEHLHLSHEQELELRAKKTNDPRLRRALHDADAMAKWLDVRLRQDGPYDAYRAYYIGYARKGQKWFYTMPRGWDTSQMSRLRKGRVTQQHIDNDLEVISKHHLLETDGMFDLEFFTPLKRLTLSEKMRKIRKMQPFLDYMEILKQEELDQIKNNEASK